LTGVGTCVLPLALKKSRVIPARGKELKPAKSWSVVCLIACSPIVYGLSTDHAVAKLYGAFRDGDGFSERALFVLDKNGTITWSYVSPVAVNPGADGILEALENLPK